MKITKQEIERVAALARLELNQEEIARLIPQLDHILSYVTKLEKLKTDGVPVTTHTQSHTNAFREDLVQESLPREKALSNTANENGESFVVPKVVG
ncbi:MAG: Asp-tRNA(Asn)/Glu-tRNA(Gln) amidotransferase subunit GatC [Candidatus Electrothrix sp. AW2]|jgi:aspartyl-tRNA(Asn)/glutamyl-tRNA(Gln) amidotransferase subunit C|nr:Asp-tRNA(Asn)/Glu-tRNA(Gln) amidotransferase subunit GatC [Candidatus Electrothrix gigas]MCI5194775.1 Asp-tRNA(Asn)/Glu-tRNA(Gln) amidotransferase subunit GatC [Candidatus Electrothrix gigas]MCI5225090.1 Asp-tRNA(Asn)/Glu-tRNA(Gln) amidotransferase subunit GatC [Candidatus Electrothrix gigas]